MRLIEDMQAIAFGDDVERGLSGLRRADPETAYTGKGIGAQPAEIDAFGIFAVCIPDIRAVVVFDPEREAFIRIRIRRAGGPGGYMNILAGV